MSILYWFLVLLMGIGVIGAVVPAIPGASLVLFAIVVWGAANGFATVGVALGVAIAVLLLSIGIDFLATYWGAKRAGASQWGQIGAVIGLILGIVGFLPALPFGGPLVGILLGPVIGAVVGEFIYQPDLKRAMKAAIGIVVGSLVGNLIQGVLAIATVIVFLATTWPPGVS
jgi:uncharacterized protein